MTTVIGWDLGGANIKLACLEAGRVTLVAQVPCPIKQDPTKFDLGVGEALALVSSPALHAVTMTGELSDVFACRKEGVAYLVGLMQKETAGTRLLIYGGKAGFLEPEEAACRTLDVASANWHASAMLVARRCGEGLLVDVGTTTTDLVPFRSRTPAAKAYTDGERLMEGELIYAGVVRTPVMAIAQDAPFQGRTQRIAGERFASMADVYRLTCDLASDADPYPTADQRGKSAGESAQRLARMLGRDASEDDIDDWVEVARHFARCQLTALEEAARALIGRERLSPDAPVIGAGCGRFLAKRLAQALARPYRDFAELIDADDETREMAARAAPAVAVALLTAETGERNC